MKAALIFLDTETTGLARTDQIWELGAIRRTPGGAETSLHLFVGHDPDKCAQLPEPFLSDHRSRFPGPCGNGTRPDIVTSPWVMSNTVQIFTSRGAPDEPRTHVIGAVPSFDTGRLEQLLEYFGLPWDWHYHLTDIENVAVGYLLASAEEMRRTAGGRDGDVLDRAAELREIATPPYDSHELSRALGVYPDDFQRHTALGDASWARAMWDAIVGSDRS